MCVEWPATRQTRFGSIRERTINTAALGVECIYGEIVWVCVFLSPGAQERCIQVKDTGT